MMLGFAFRVLWGPWLVVPVAFLEVANLFQRGMPWRGEGMWTVEWFAIALFIIGPLCAGAAAVDAARLSRPGNIHLVLSVPQRPLAFLWAVAWCAGPVAVIHLTAIVAGLIVGRVTEPSAGWPALAAAAGVQVLAIVWYAAIGSLIGRFLSPLLAGLAGVVSGFVLFYILSEAALGAPTRFSLLDFGGATITLLGRAYNPGYLVGQAAVLSLTSALFLIVGLRARPNVRTPSGKGMLSMATAAVMIVAATYWLPQERMVPDPHVPTSCTGTDPVICLHDEHRRFHNLVGTQIRILMEAAREEGYQAFVPERVEESSHTYRPAPQSGVMEFWLPAEAYEQGELTLEGTVITLLTPRHCDELRAALPPGEEYWWRLASLTLTWLHLSDAEVDPVLYETGYRPTVVLEPEEVTEILEDFRHCNLEGRR